MCRIPSRSSSVCSTTFPPRWVAVLMQALSVRTAAGPVVGVEVRAGMTDHAQVVAGLRVHTLGQSVVDGWMIRPSVGLAWKF